MLQDRNYMRRDPRRQEDHARDGFHALIGLILANFIVFFIQHMMPGRELDSAFALSVHSVKQFEVWRFFTALFLHAGFGHIFFNMFGLYIFGALAAPVLGAKRFLLLYFTAGVLGNLLWFFCNWNNPYYMLFGASGAVMGVILASAMMLPDIPMMLLFIPFPLKLKTLAMVYIFLEIFSQITNSASVTSYLAHILGFVSGYLFMKFCAKDRVVWDPLQSLKGKTASISGNDREPGLPNGWKMTSTVYKKPDHSVSRQELERLLIKLSREGINALTEEEQETLRRAREEMINRK